MSEEVRPCVGESNREARAALARASASGRRRRNAEHKVRQPEVSFEMLCDALCGFLRAHVLADDVTFGPETPLNGIGVDSLSIVEMLLFVERRFGATLPDAELTHRNLESVASLARCIVGLKGAPDFECPPVAGRQPPER